MPVQLNAFSSRIAQPRSQGASQAMLNATGLREADMDKPHMPPYKADRGTLAKYIRLVDAY